MYIIYQITNLVNHKIYIGKHETTDVNDSYFGSGKAIKHAIRKYGKQNFKKEVLFIFDVEQEALDKEKEIVNESFITRTDTYNMTLGGVGSWHHLKGIPLSEERKQYLSNLYRGRQISDETKAKISKSLTGKARSKEVVLQMSLRRIGTVRTEESKLKQSNSVMGDRNHFYGKTHSAETKKKISNREYTNKKQLCINGTIYNSITEAYTKLNLGVNYLTPIVKNLNDLNPCITTFHRPTNQQLVIELVMMGSC